MATDAERIIYTHEVQDISIKDLALRVTELAKLNNVSVEFTHCGIKIIVQPGESADFIEGMWRGYVKAMTDFKTRYRLVE